GETTTGNSIQHTSTGWAPLEDIGPQGLPFKIHGTGGQQFAKDVGISAIPQPVTGVNLTATEAIAVTIRNYGTNAQSSIPWSVNWDGPTGAGSATGTYAGTIAPGETATVNLTQTANLSTYGDYTFTACTALSGDENPANNCKEKTVSNKLPEYCPASTVYEDEYISNVLCGSINNSSGWQGGVADYTAIFTEINAGASEAITVTNGNPWSSDKVTCWVDWDMSYTFDDGSEKFVLTSNAGGANFTGAIAVPAGTPDGDYRMRVRMSYSSDPVPCGPMNYGEVEDYTIKVGGGTPPPAGWLSVNKDSGSVEAGQQEIVTVTFNSTDLTPGTYQGAIKIASNDPATPLVTVPVTLIVHGDVLPPPTNLVATIVDFINVDLTWNAPDIGGFDPQWITYSNEDIGNSIGTGGAISFDVAARWTPDMIGDFAGGMVTKIDFVPGEPGNVSTYEVKVWQGGNNNPTLKYSQAVTNIVEDQWNTVELTQPVTIDVTQELWIGFSVNTTGGHPAGCDGGPQTEGFGNMMFWNGAWTTLSQLGTGLDYNWAVKGYVEGGMQVEGYIVYRQEPGQPSFEEIGTTDMNTLNYFDPDLDYGVYKYHVKAKYGEQLISGPSNEVTIGITSINDPSEASGALQVYPNPANDHFTIKAETELQRVIMVNYSGQVVMNRKATGNEMLINANEYAKGVYTLQVETKDGRSVHKVIIQ
ncbi:T9SS type A sorting domain-containing protein, partial [Candidatus Falkowbacteria bacterium]|nr:T9SS type A sorting domain-containing protein [Candidatus Falkowbacteria bacterium]